MLITSIKEEITFPFENGIEILKCSDVTNGINPHEEFSNISINRNVTSEDEHTQNDLSQLVSTLEGKLFVISCTISIIIKIICKLPP